MGASESSGSSGGGGGRGTLSRLSSKLSRQSSARMSRLARATPLGICTSASEVLHVEEHDRLKRGDLLLQAEYLRELVSDMPTLVRFSPGWKLFFSPKVHGISMDTFYRAMEQNEGPSLILMRDASSGCIFGGFAPEAWCCGGKGGHKYYGSAESFVFDLKKDSPQFQVYPAGGEQLYMRSDRACLAMGASAWNVSSDFLRCQTRACSTFNTKEPLSSSDEVVLDNFEAWTPWADPHPLSTVVATKISNVGATSSAASKLGRKSLAARFRSSMARPLGKKNKGGAGEGARGGEVVGRALGRE